MSMVERIVAAAIEYKGITFSIPAPARHHNVAHKLIFDLGLTDEAQRNQGFLTSTGRFVDREEACRIATSAGQIVKKTSPDYMLFSEDVW